MKTIFLKNFQSNIFKKKLMILFWPMRVDKKWPFFKNIWKIRCWPIFLGGLRFSDLNIFFLEILRRISKEDLWKTGVGKRKILIWMRNNFFRFGKASIACLGDLELFGSFFTSIFGMKNERNLRKKFWKKIFKNSKIWYWFKKIELFLEDFLKNFP